MKTNQKSNQKFQVEPNKLEQSKFSGPLFIIGMPRSGTKLLRTLLNNHRQIFIPSIETNFIHKMNRWIYDHEDIKDVRNFHSFYTKMSQTSYFQYRRLEGRPIIQEDEWYQSCSSFTTQELFRTLIFFDLGLKDNCSNIIWGDKSPSYINHVTLIKGLYPKAKFIHIIRDVRDYCLSINKAWGKNMIRAAYRWNNDIINFVESFTPFVKDVFEIKYEELIDNPKECLNKACNFLEIKYEENMHILMGTSENLGEAKNLKIIKRDNKNKYLSELNPRVLSQIEGIAYNCLNKYGYSTNTVPNQIIISKPKLFFYKLLDGMNLLKFYIKERGISYLFSNK